MAAYKFVNSEMSKMRLPSVNYRISADYGKAIIAKSASSQAHDLFGPILDLCTKINSNTYLAEDIQNYRQNPDYPNFTLISSDTKNTMFAGIPGYELLFSYANNYTTGLSKEIGTILGDKACSVVYDSVLSQYSINEPVLNPMIDSLVINVPKSNQTRIFNPTSGNATASQRSSTSEIIPEI
jgi:hypothetical protein